MHHSPSFFKKISLALGVAGIGVLAGLPALAQSTSSGGTPEFELSKEGYIILCDRTPLNSRCEGSPYYTGSTSQSPEENPAFSPSGTTAPTQNLPSETDETDPSSAGESLSPDSDTQDGSMPDESSSDSSDSVGTPSNTTAPTENLPSESDETDPSSKNQSPSSMQEGSYSGGSVDSPSNTTAPTQDLPSETDGK